MRAALLLGGAVLAAGSVPVQAQQHPGHMMPCMRMPAPRPSPTPAPTPRPTPRRAQPAAQPAPGHHAQHEAEATSDPAEPANDAGMAVDDPMPMHQHDAPADIMPEMAPTGTALPAGDAPPPPVPTDHYADRDYRADAMASARDQMMREQGGQIFHQLMFNLAEVQARPGQEGYRWDGEGWIGGDINRFVLKSEGEGSFGGNLETAEAQALYSRAIGPYFDLQAGVRHDFGPLPDRTYATIGVEGLAPYMFEVEAAGFLSTEGEVLGRLEGWYDQRLTQRLVLQPRVELNLSAQDVPETRTGAGLVDAELGLRLRYEIAREFAPYVGVSYEAMTGRTAGYARAAGEDATTTSFVAGVRFWF